VPLAVTILAILVVGAIVGSALNFGSLFLGIPIVLLFVGGVIGKETMDRQARIMRMKRFRRDARAQKIEFDQADKRTVV
jgi:uncharacterized membrane protein